MKGLIFKDLYNLKKPLISFIIIVFIINYIISKTLGGAFNLLIIGTVIFMIQSIQGDRNCKWNKYSLTMPITRKDIIKSKYILMGILLVGFTAVAIISDILFSVTVHNSLLTSITGTLNLSFWILLFTSTEIAFLYMTQNVKRAGVVQLILVLVLTLLYLGLNGLIKTMNLLYLLSYIEFYKIYILASISIIISIVSYITCVKIYNKKDLAI